MASEVDYRFPRWKDASWNSFERQQARYSAIQPFLRRDLVGAEIGVYKGGFGEFLLPHCAKLYLVDPWYRAAPFWDTSIANDSRVETVINMLSVYKKDIEKGRVEVVVDYAAGFFQSIPDQHLDFVYIDASHKYESTMTELRMAHRKVKASGHLFGDDYDPNPSSRQHGVYLAVNEFAADVGASLIVNHTRQWGLALPEIRR